MEKDSVPNVSLFSKAGLFSKMSFCWLNPLMKLGRKKTLVEDDIPELRDIDRAGSCYSQFLDQLSKTRKKNKVETLSESSIFWTIVMCHRREILISAVFALLKILTISATPLLLKSFIQISEGHKQAFRYQKYVLAFSLFLSKILESFSQRHWFFQARLIGLKVRSMLIASIYRKQLQLSNDARGVHSGSAIVNYVIVDTYRIGEFPFCFHQTWTTIIQLLLALAILIHTVHLATVAALVVTVAMLLLNIPIPKLQHKFQRKLMVAQDARLKACSEALVNMKVLKNLCLCWMTPIWVSAATLGACYFLRIPLHASNVFTFLATVRLLQEPMKIIPDVIGVVVQARVSFARIVKFLAAPELQIENVRKVKSDMNDHAILTVSSNISWDMKSKPTLRNINLDVHPGEKIAICGEVGSGKSTLLAAILGEVPCIDGTEYVVGALSGKTVLLVTHQVDFLP